MRSGGNYSRLGVDDQEIESIELSQSVENPLRRGEEFTIRVLFKEKTHEIHHLTPNSTITQLKNASTAVTDVPFLRQRLIFAGRPLRPDDATLSSLGLCHNAAVHLFPIPETLPVTPSSVPMETATTISSSASTTGLVHGIASYGPLPNGIGAIPMRSVRRNNGDGSIYDADSHRIVHPDPTVVQTATKARIWSVVLLSLSAFALVSDLSYVLSLGTFGDNLLSSIVVILDITSSIGGIAVGFQGMKAVRTMNLQETKTYVGGLAFVGILSLVMRCLWVFDMIHAAKRAVRESEDNAQAREDAGEATDDQYNSQPLDPSLVSSIAFQAVCIALMCLFAWGTCFHQAYEFHQALNSATPQAEPAPTIAVVVEAVGVNDDASIPTTVAERV